MRKFNLKNFIRLRNDFLEKSRYAKIAHHTAATMETINLNELTADHSLAHLVNPISSSKSPDDFPSFQLTPNSDDSFNLKNILCVPIMDGDGHVIGVCQVMNKLNERLFTDDDVAIIEVRERERERNQ